MYPRRYIIFNYPDHGPLAFDLYETMNRTQYFGSQAIWNPWGCRVNCETLTSVRFGDTNPEEAMMFPRHSHYDIEKIPLKSWMFGDGVRVDMEAFHAQEREEAQMDQIVADFEEQHPEIALGGMFNPILIDFDERSTDTTEAETDIGMELEQEIADFMGQWLEDEEF